MNSYTSGKKRGCPLPKAGPTFSYSKRLAEEEVDDVGDVRLLNVIVSKRSVVFVHNVLIKFPYTQVHVLSEQKYLHTRCISLHGALKRDALAKQRLRRPFRNSRTAGIARGVGLALALGLSLALALHAFRNLRDNLTCGLEHCIVPLSVVPAAVCPPLRRTPPLPRAVPPLFEPV